MDQHFWDDIEKAQNILQQLKGYKELVEAYDRLCMNFEDIFVLIEMAGEAGDEELVQEVKDSAKAFQNDYDKMLIATLLDEPYDKNDVILELHPGAGGTEACDWVSMLLRMYTRWADSRGFKTEVLDYLDGEEAGVKSVTLQISGPNAYGYLKSEKGIHRLVRISPFDASGRRHTSFASCDVIPQITDEIAVNKIGRASCRERVFLTV